MTSGYDLNTALEQLEKERQEDYEKLHKTVVQDDFISYVIQNIDLSVSEAYERLMEVYAELVQEEDIRERFHGRLLEEMQRVRE